LTDRAVNETFGLVLAGKGREVVNAPYASVCGGHTENNENIWSGNARSHLRGVPDRASAQGTKSNLANEDSLRAWLASQPPANCNLEGARVPPGMAYARKYFRWHVQFSATELRDNIRKQTGEDPGDLLDLQPVRRGLSGRVTTLKVVGTKKTFEITRELAIRQSLSPQTLWSSLFVVDKIPSGATGSPAQFIFHGAGAGHGVGMCQIGAAMMALRGSRHETILQHYYSEAELMRAY
jgi:peptidoglycan hydrolase-like amidase